MRRGPGASVAVTRKAGKPLVFQRTAQVADGRVARSALREFSGRIGPWAAALILGLAVIGACLPADARAQSPNAVTLLYFRAAVEGTSVHLTWQTGSEVDNGGFELWRSEQGSDPGRGVRLEEFAPRGDVVGAFYEYTDTDVELNRTYSYTLVAFDIYGNEESYPSDPREVTVGQAQPSATATPTATAMPTTVALTATPTTVAPTATAMPTATTAPQQNPLPTTPPAATPAFSTPPSQAVTATPVPAQVAPPTATPVPTATLPQASVSQLDTPSPAAETELPTDTPVPPTASSAFADSPLLPTPVPAAGATDEAAPQPTAAVQAPQVTLVAPNSGQRPTPTPRPADGDGQSEGGPRALLAVIAVLAIAAAAVLVGLIVLILLRARGGA